jgi:hypothetical protein
MRSGSGNFATLLRSAARPANRLPRASAARCCGYRVEKP